MRIRGRGKGEDVSEGEVEGVGEFKISIGGCRQSLAEGMRVRMRVRMVGCRKNPGRFARAPPMTTDAPLGAGGDEGEVSVRVSARGLCEDEAQDDWL